MRRFREDRGQATVELALVLPVLLIGLVALVQAGALIASQVSLEHAAREGARAAAVDPPNAVSVAHDAVRSDGQTEVVVDVGHRHVSVTVTRTVSLVPFVSSVGSTTLEARAVMLREDLARP